MNGSSIEDLKLQKRARFHMILEWEQRRSEECGKYKNTLTTLVTRILQKLSNSSEANIAVVKFLKEKAVGSLQYSEILVAELTYLPDPSTPRQRSSLASGLSSVSQFQLKLSSTFISLSQKIQ